MKMICIALGIACLVANSASAQDSNPFSGKWDAAWTSGRSANTAVLVMERDTGTWQRSGHQKNNPCIGLEAPIRVDEVSSEKLKLTVLFTTVISSCQDSVVNVHPVDPSTLEGTVGIAGTSASTALTLKKHD